MGKIELYNEDCMETMSRIETGSVDLMLTDPPYGVTQNEWDLAPNLPVMWAEWERILKPNGAWIFFAQQPFCADLIVSRRGFFKYDLIWEKDRISGFLNGKKMPLRSHEHMMVFYRQLPTYNPQTWRGKPQHSIGNKEGTRPNQTNYGGFDYDNSKEGNEEKLPRSVWYSPKPHPPVHPTQKPVDLIRELIRTYSNPGELIFDGYSGSGTTAHACIMEQRDFIGSELNKEYFDKAQERINDAQKQLCLFSA